MKGFYKHLSNSDTDYVDPQYEPGVEDTYADSIIKARNTFIVVANTLIVQ